MSIKLGPFQLEHPFILAPMAGITTSPFRRLMRRMGNSLSITELISANGMHYGAARTMEYLRFAPEERPIGIQIFGEDSERLCKAAQIVEQAGADFVDLNLGCPVPKVVKKGGGSAMCRDPRALGQTLEAMVKSIRIPLTIKIRTGWDAGSRNALEVVRVAADSGVAWVAIHGRTRAQGYSGLADWDLIGDVKAKSPIPIIGNGDILTPEIAIEKMRTYAVDAVMIGRAALRNPFIFEQTFARLKGETFAAPTADRYVKMLQDLRVLFEEFYDARGSIIHARKFLAWFSSGFPGCHEFRKNVFTIAESDALWKLAEEFFQRSTSARDMRFLSEPFLMGGHG